MADYKVTDTELASIANAIRTKTGKSAQIEFPTEFVSEIGSISGGGGDVEPTLPAEYQEVEYIDFDGNSYVTINSQYIQNNDQWETFATYTDGNTSEQVFIGVDNPSNTERFEMYFSGGQAKIYNGTGDTICRGAIQSLSAPKPSSIVTPNLNISVGDKVYFMFELFSWSVLKYLRIGAYGTGGKFRSRLFKIKHCRRIEIIGDASTGNFGTYKYETFAWYKPCYRKSDNVAGWYDTHNDVFHTNEGSGTFVVGPDVV